MIRDGVFDDWLCALLRRREGRWQAVVVEIGATDVPRVGWSEQYEAPRDIFRKVSNPVASATFQEA